MSGPFDASENITTSTLCNLSTPSKHANGNSKGQSLLLMYRLPLGQRFPNGEGWLSGELLMKNLSPYTMCKIPNRELWPWAMVKRATSQKGLATTALGNDGLLLRKWHESGSGCFSGKWWWKGMTVAFTSSFAPSLWPHEPCSTTQLPHWARKHWVQLLPRLPWPSAAGRIGSTAPSLIYLTAEVLVLLLVIPICNHSFWVDSAFSLSP